MKKIFLIIPAACLVALFCLPTAQAQLVNADKAHVIALNWIETIIDLKGQWADSPTARVAEIAEFKRDNRVLGYFCRVEPSGHIVVSLMEGLAPVKAFSEFSELDPYSDEGPVDVLKLKMEYLLDEIERQFGPLASVHAADMDRILRLNHREAWQQLESGTLQVDQIPKTSGTNDDYQESQILLTSRWHQGAPYNNQCPNSPAEYNCSGGHCLVGCVATAGAQIMRYWSWPPGRDWLNMPDQMAISPTTAEIDAVAELCRTIGDLLTMVYCEEGSCQSAIPTEYMAPVYEAWNYDDDCNVVYRLSFFDWHQWYTIIMDNLNQNRPIQYRIKEHSIVCDGYWNLPTPLYHMNYGWSNGYDDWYAVDDLYQVGGGTILDEYIVHKIYPKGALGPSISGTYPYNAAYPHRYVDRDCSASSVQFAAGQNIHFLPYIRMTCTGGTLRFDGQPGLSTRLYTADFGRGIRIDDGSIVAYQDGAIKFRLQRPD